MKTNLKPKLAILSAAIILCLALGTSQPVEARNYPCSKGKGGVAHCTNDGQHVCKDGTTSKSKYKCTSAKK